MTVNVDDVVTRYYGPIPLNPVYKEVITNLVDSGLYTSALATGPAVNPAFDGNILQYTNGLNVPNAAVPLEVLVDAVTKAVLKGYRDGFAGSIDSAVNINFTNTSLNPNLVDSDNLHNAVVKLANEVNLLRTALESLVGPQFLTAMQPLNKAADLEDLTKIKI